MSTCTVSILMPTLNSVLYLTERMETILRQTLTNWELIVADSYSTDGTWEIIQSYARQDSRLKIFQIPKGGMYLALNYCIQLAQGQYIYIATSDDTMESTCLEIMVSGLEAHPHCDMCHTCLTVIDEKGYEIKDWWVNTPVAQFYGDLMNQTHIRLAPYDGILHCALRTVYLSLTQLLMRRSLFDKVGLFRSDWGAESDFEWGMRASLVCNVLHLPEKLATWRIHPNQLTTQDTSENHQIRLCQMIRAAILILRVYNSDFYRQLDLKRLLVPYQQEHFLIGWAKCHSYLQKFTYVLGFLRLSRLIVYRFFWDYLLFGQVMFNPAEYLRQELQRLGLESYIQVFLLGL